MVVQAGTAVDASGRVISAGGRVLAVVGTGDDLAEARSRAYARIGKSGSTAPSIAHDIAESGADARSTSSGAWLAIGNVLANRYASARMREIWTAESKIIAERRLWLAVLAAQRDLGVDFGEMILTR